MSDVMLDRAVGCLMGQVSGDSLGSLVEFKDPETISELYPDGVRDLADGGVWNTIAGQPTDDSELALALARVLVGQAAWDSEPVAAAYADWYLSRPFDIGGTTMRAFAAAASGRDDRAGSARSAASEDSQANGALMRCAAIGLWAWDAAEAASAARQDALLSHPHPVCQAASAAFVAAIHVGVAGDDRDAMLAAAESVMPEASAASLQRALALARSGHGPEDFMHQQGWVLTAFQNAFRHLAIGTTVEHAVIATVGEGGDTDTNGAICGALLGAADGGAGIPARWSAAILACRPMEGNGIKRPRPACYWPVDVPVLAAGLVRRRMRQS
ncbi:ADP-ribosylglycohydrolase [Rhodoligotrophos appendicifer]|uniref:ADP-ribosylglycohydrolase family protein n=1 Tax=Rhodoligotrophos appendicifer TaxID=987056 RepID=UPI00195F68D0|nr:ADP-ribosylglycohydrolase family protein [Rhodoligotrophos appendicifer]